MNIVDEVITYFSATLSAIIANPYALALLGTLVIGMLALTIVNHAKES